MNIACIVHCVDSEMYPMKKHKKCIALIANIFRIFSLSISIPPSPSLNLSRIAEQMHTKCMCTRTAINGNEYIERERVISVSCNFQFNAFFCAISHEHQSKFLASLSKTISAIWVAITLFFSFQCGLHKFSANKEWLGGKVVLMLEWKIQTFLFVPRGRHFECSDICNCHCIAIIICGEKRRGIWSVLGFSMMHLTYIYNVCATVTHC